MVGLVLTVVFGGMTAAVLVDRVGAGRSAPEEPAGLPTVDSPPAAASMVSAPVPDPAGAGRELRRFPELAEHARGWALITAGSTVVATDTPGAALLLARACAVLTEQGEGDTESAPWESMRLEGSAGLLLAQTGSAEARLAVLTRPGAPEAAVRAAMSHALARVAQRHGQDGDGLEAGDGAAGPVLADGPDRPAAP